MKGKTALMLLVGVGAVGGVAFIIYRQRNSPVARVAQQQLLTEQATKVAIESAVRAGVAAGLTPTEARDIATHPATRTGAGAF